MKVVVHTIYDTPHIHNISCISKFNKIKLSFVLVRMAESEEWEVQGVIEEVDEHYNP